MTNIAKTGRTTAATSAVLMSEPTPIEGMVDSVDSLREELASGRAILRAVAYPWGVEFDVCRMEVQP